jgi:phosphate-selective porin OprO and OprP
MFVRSLFVAALVAGAAPAFAQSSAAGQQPAASQTSAPAGQTPAAPAPAAAPPAATAPLTAAWQDGFIVQSANGDYRVQLGAVVQSDGRFSVDDPLPITNTFTLRKARPIVSGRIARYFDFRLMTEFGNGTPTVLDAYVDTRFSQGFRLRAGKDKTPIGYELLIGDANLYFPERSLASSLVPNRDVGFQAQGDLRGGKVTYSGGIFNGQPDGVSSTTDVDTNSNKDLAGRIVLQPFRSTAPSAGPLSGFGVHIGGSYGKQAGALPVFRTSVGQTYFSYAVGATATGARNRITPALFYFYKSLGVFGEYVRSTQDVARTGVTREISNDAWEITASYLLTGEAASVGNIRPRRSFDPATSRWGAVQLLTRYSQLKVDPLAFSTGLAAVGASRKAEQFTAALNWYPTNFIKWYATFERTVFDGDAAGPRPAENVILFRAQVAF